MKAFFIDGDFRDFDDPSVNYLRFDGLTENEVLSVARYALPRGFQVVLIAEEGDKAGEAEKSEKEP